MARLHRLSLYSSIFVLLYLLALYQVLPIPLIDVGIVQEILPVVRVFQNERLNSRICVNLDSMVALGVIRVLFPLDPRLGGIYVP
jgi:hypothetical protein